jgi:serine/threonine-protein kinase
METQSAAKMTKTGNAMGTPAFMPPEQALGNWSQVDARSDLWAVGASLFTLLSGRLVHEAPTLNQLLLKAMTQPAPPIRDVLPGLPADVAEVVDRALAFQQKDRWPDAAAMQRAVRKAIATIDASGEPALEPVTRGSGAVAGADSMMATLVRDPASAPPSRSSRRGILAGLAALMVLGSGVALAAFSGVKLAPSTVVAAAQPPPMPSEAPAVTPAPVPSTVETRPAAQTSPTTSSIAAAPPPSARPATSTSKGRNPFKGFH